MRRDLLLLFLLMGGSALFHDKILKKKIYQFPKHVYVIMIIIFQEGSED